MSSRISEQTPSFCTVYAVSKGKLSSMRPSDSGPVGSFKDDRSDTSCSTHSSSSHASSLRAGNFIFLLTNLHLLINEWLSRVYFTILEFLTSAYLCA